MVKNLPANAGDTGSIPVLGRSHMPQRNWARVPPLLSPSAATTETHAPGAISLIQSLSHVRLFATPWTTALQAPLSMGILQARILEWIAIPVSRGSSQPRDQTQVSCIASGFFTV